MKNIKEYDDFVNESKLDDQLNSMFNTDNGEGIYYETISPDDDNNTIELGLIAPEFGGDKQMFNEFKHNYLQNKDGRVICATCGCAAIHATDSNNYDEISVELESDDLDPNYIKKNLLNVNDDDLLFECTGDCEDEINSFIYKGRYYHYIRNSKGKRTMSIGKKLLTDIANDL